MPATVFEGGRVLRRAVIAVLLSTVVPVVGWVATGAALARAPHCLPTAAHPVGPHGFPGLGNGRKQRCVYTNAAPPVMLFFHPGGWILGPGHPMTPEQEAARMQGFETINVDYVLGDVPTAFAQAVQLARQLKKRGRRVYAYGESAGGTMAAFLAQRGLVDAAAVHSPVSSIPDFINRLASSGNYPRDFFDQLLKLTPQTEEVFSPAFRRKKSKRPIFAIAPQSDALSPGTVEWASRDPNVTLVTPSGNHLEQSNFPEMLAQSMSWLRNRVKADKREDHGGRQRTKKPRDPMARPASFDRRATQMKTGALERVIRTGSADPSLPVRDVLRLLPSLDRGDGWSRRFRTTSPTQYPAQNHCFPCKSAASRPKQLLRQPDDFEGSASSNRLPDLALGGRVIALATLAEVLA